MLLETKTKQVLKKYTHFGDRIKNLIKTINGCKEGEYKKDFMKIKFSSDNNFPLDRILKLRMLTIVIRSVFEDDKYYPQNFLVKSLYDL